MQKQKYKVPKGKALEEELYRELNTMEKNDLIDTLVSWMNEKDKKEWVRQWHDY